MKNKIITILTIVLLFSCNDSKNNIENENLNKNEEKQVQDSNKYKYHNNYSKQELDTIKTNLASFIIKKPAVATWETKFDLVFRQYFIENRNKVEFVYLSDKQNDGSFYYYLLREARDINGIQKRGVGGKYKINDEDLKIFDFEEIFNTPILEEAKLIEIGFYLIEELINTGGVEKYLDNKSYIEWPDDRLFYSKEKYEWRYVD